MTTDYSDIFVNRNGFSDKSYMITNRLIDIYKKNSILLFSDGNIICYDTKLRNLDTNNTKLTSAKSNFTDIIKNIPPNIIIRSQIKNTIESNNNNILGKNQIMILDQDDIIIPLAETTIENLAFYNCKLISEGTIFSLKNNVEMPLFNMSIGEDYVDDYLLQYDFGGGFYIETHDTPHYHQPLDINSNGYIILGKYNNNDMMLSKFKIPYKHALYIPPNTLHSDAYLVGNYNVMYTKTDNYNTYLFRTPNNDIVKIE